MKTEFLAVSGVVGCIVLVACSDSGAEVRPDGGGTVIDSLNRPCPAAKAPALVRIRAPGLRSMCIDSTEVTVDQYAAFVADTAGRDGARSSFCPTDKTDKPDSTCLSDPSVCKGASCGSHPQVCVTTCSARAYCKWAGKVLCGAEDWSEAEKTNGARWGWINACGNGVGPDGAAAQGFPYGQARSPEACNGPQKGLRTTVPVGSLATCQSPNPEYKGVFDLSGNVGEWVEQGEDERLGHVAGGSFSGSGSGASGDCVAGLTSRVDRALPDVGFRCCSAVADDSSPSP